MSGSEVCDNNTGLVWEQSPSTSTFTHANALTHCTGLGSGNSLPEIKQLISLLDYSQHNPVLPVGHPFSNVQSSFYWSASTVVSQPPDAWGVGISLGFVKPLTNSSSQLVWCARGGS